MKIKIFTILLLYSSLLANYEYNIANTNFTIFNDSSFSSKQKDYLYNYNRFRYKGDYTNNNYFINVIADVVNYLSYDYINSSPFSYIKLSQSNTPFKTQTKFYNYNEGEIYAKVYRLYGGYEDEKNRLIVGLQNITMGVGRIWTPTNLFNPRNIYALEPDEVFGVASINYTRHLDENSQFTAVISQNENHIFKYATRYKSFLKFADVAIDLISTNETTMIGYELEGNLGKTGVEVRTEGAYIKSRLNKSSKQIKEEEFFQGIVGADYGFKNGIILVVEALYSSKIFNFEEIVLNMNSETIPNLVTSNLYLGSTITYAFNLLFDGSITLIKGFNNGNPYLVMPSLAYNINDFNSFTLGAIIERKERENKLTSFVNTYFFKYSFLF